MEIVKTSLSGVYIINNFNAQDSRGTFVKMFNKESFLQENLDFDIRESYYSISKKNVIRGMHFQTPPHDHEKLVYVPQGKILDLIVDLRPNSKTYKNYISVEISGENKKSVIIPKGLAHGFRSLENDTITVYNVSTEYNPNFDYGISYNSFGFNWEIEQPILSKRDAQFISLEDFCVKNPF
ncbi:dTDP-4-dehydrorhamnose 3,5-epimerase family protein [Seonamhaeicola marinus]|uniref:dTDP-4-dehydrorhamnose 3,5-epimerase n=1 Tax=Seonamhaeicola marinus TaxID=1912246 RepID=A0A5D0HXF5_9FLAO|nr:dTDP-4-dehydrorhamnose 3,5-epimerase family protein [Seonamhaeicola marinus]TYA74132.1 dTDP-4-keto-6-deoxy-D-glucose epimerase [Seonamhaeicola marinus]